MYDYVLQIRRDVQICEMHSINNDAERVFANMSYSYHFMNNLGLSWFTQILQTHVLVYQRNFIHFTEAEKEIWID